MVMFHQKRRKRQEVGFNGTADGMRLLPGFLAFFFLGWTAVMASAFADDGGIPDAQVFNRDGDGPISLEAGEPGGRKMLFLGNSITLHSARPELGWTNRCGMAASCLANLRRKPLWSCCDCVIMKNREKKELIQ